MITFLPRGHGNVGTCATLNPRSDPYVIHGRSSRHNGNGKHAVKQNKEKITGKKYRKERLRKRASSLVAAVSGREGVSKFRLGFSIMRNTF